MIRTRFAPSPTGAFHLGGARTALFNYLFARRHQGQFLLRIEDTDKARSSAESEQSILNGLRWLGLDWDQEPIHQSARADRHIEIARELVAQDKAYYCTCSPAMLDQQRKAAAAEKRPIRYDRRCRNAGHKEGAIRVKTPLEGKTRIDDQIQGEIITQNSQLDDFIILRSDGSPTYMLCVVVDDYDMAISHVIRGSDHLTNAVRQATLYHAMGWAMPIFAHIPLIHGIDGTKLSKRHGAEDISAYREQGYLPEAMCNHLARLGWAHGDDEIFTTEQAIAWFSLEAIGKSPARFDLVKLTNLNGHYLRHMPDEALMALFLEQAPSKNEDYQHLMPILRLIAERSKTLTEFAKNARFLISVESQKLTAQETELIRSLIPKLTDLNWDKSTLERAIRAFADDYESLKIVVQPIRVLLVGQENAPGIFDIMVALGQKETMRRIKRIL